MFWKKKKPLSVSADDERTIIGLIWSLKPSDLSTLEALLQTAEESQIATTRDSTHAIFWFKLTALGLAHEIPLNDLKDTLTSFSPTPHGKELLGILMKAALTTGWPPRDAIITPDAIQMLQRYADEGVAPAQSKLAILYDQGAGIEQSSEAALKWYRAAAEQGDTTALNNLAIEYLSGENIGKNPDEALKCFKLAAEKGSLGAMDNIGEIYVRGIGVPPDLVEAFKWFRMAADRGHGAAICTVADFYGKGLGMEKDDYQAYIWYSLGLAAGFDTSKPLADAASRLTPVQIQEADLLVSQWKPVSNQKV